MEQTIIKTAEQEYHHNYYMENKDYWHNYYLNTKDKYRESKAVRAKTWRSINSGKYVYFLVDEDGKFVYTGSYFDRPLIERISFHMNGHSNLKMTGKQLQENFGLSVCLFKSFEKYDLNSQDILFIEDYFKKNYSQVLGKNKVNWKEENLSKTQKELIEIAELEPFEEFDIDKYLY